MSQAYEFKEIWKATNGGILNCVTETGNSFDPFAVSMVKGGLILCGGEIISVLCIAVFIDFSNDAYLTRPFEKK